MKPGYAMETVAMILFTMSSFSSLVLLFLKSFSVTSSSLRPTFSTILSAFPPFRLDILVTIKTPFALATASKTSIRVTWSCWLTASWVTLSDVLQEPGSNCTWWWQRNIDGRLQCGEPVNTADTQQKLSFSNSLDAFCSAVQSGHWRIIVADYALYETSVRRNITSMSTESINKMKHYFCLINLI